jgi:hypothetical protein
MQEDFDNLLRTNIYLKSKIFALLPEPQPPRKKYADARDTIVDDTTKENKENELQQQPIATNDLQPSLLPHSCHSILQ